MSKTGLKTFVCSFVVTLSVVLGADRAFFCTPKVKNDDLKIPRKNISLFFKSEGLKVASSRVEQVDKVLLQRPEYQAKEIDIAQKIPVIPEHLVVREIPQMVVENGIPLQKNITENVVDNKDNILGDDNVPLVYAEVKEETKHLVLAQKEENNDMVELVASVKTEANQEKKEEISNGEVEKTLELALLSRPVVIKGTRQIIKIDNTKKHKKYMQETDLKAISVENKDIEQEDEILAQGDELDNFIPLVAEKKDEPAKNQIASLTQDFTANAVKEVKVNDKEEKSRKWKTMSEEAQGDNPWVVARGSKFVKNKQVLKEEFASERAKDKANKDGLIVSNITNGTKSAKIAVQDNILIPVPPEFLDEDNLVPVLDDADVKNKKTKPEKKEKKVSSQKEGTFLDSLTSMFSKENREKAIKNIKEKSEKLGKKIGTTSGDSSRPQILPTEIRLSFQPGRAEISGQTLRWVQAFAKKAVEDDGVGLEIRIDGAGAFVLQQKRLNLLYNIFSANGVEARKINTLFVDREANSFVIRTVRVTGGVNKKKEDDEWKKYYQHW